MGPRERLTEEIGRVEAALERAQDDAAGGGYTAAMLETEVRHLKRARSVAFDSAPLTPSAADEVVLLEPLRGWCGGIGCACRTCEPTEVHDR